MAGFRLGEGGWVCVGTMLAGPVEGVIRSSEGLALRPPRLEDGGTLWALARAAGGLDVNSPYAYLVLCRSFARTCVLAEADDQPVGFLSAFRPPSDPAAVFIWQLGVLPAYRRRGVAGALVRGLLARPACAGVRFVEATTTPGNAAVRALFRRLAAAAGTRYQEGSGFDRTLFPDGAHASEQLLRVGPLC